MQISVMCELNFNFFGEISPKVTTVLFHFEMAYYPTLPSAISVGGVFIDVL